MTPFEFRQDHWRQKTIAHGLSCGVACVIPCLAVLIQYERVTDGRTDRGTDRRRRLILFYRAFMAIKDHHNSISFTIILSKFSFACSSFHSSELHLAPTVSASQLLRSGTYRMLTSADFFRRHLKTNYFQQAFRPTSVFVLRLRFGFFSIMLQFLLNYTYRSTTQSGRL